MSRVKTGDRGLIAAMKERNQALKGKYGDFEKFPIGTKVQVKDAIVDFISFNGTEVGRVVKNSGKYLGIIVKFKHVRFNDTQDTWNFNPHHLTRIKKASSPQ